jgi:hypothetical protein
LNTTKLTPGELITAAFAELKESRREVLIYLGGFLFLEIAAATAPGPLRIVGGAGGLVAFGAYFVGQYLLYRLMLRRAGFVSTDGRMRIFRFIALAIVIGFALMFAVYLFVIPAIILAARWITAPCVLVASERGLFDTLGDSWKATSGNTLPLSLAFTAMFLIFMVLSVAISTLEAALDGMAGSNVTISIGYHFLPLLLMGLSVATYRRLEGADRSLAEVFA